MAAVQHQDFGEKIGGAKKDLWRIRGLYSFDLDDMNEREADHHVKKDNIWKRPDYQALVDDGVPIGVAYYIKKVRDAISPRPVYRMGDNTPELRLARQKQYIDTIREIQTVTEQVRTVQDVLTAVEKVLIAPGYLERRDSGYGWTAKGRENPLLDHKLFQTIRVASERMYQFELVNPAQREQFGVPKEQRVPAGYSIRFYTGNGYSARENWEINTFYVTKGYAILQTNFQSYEDALKYAQDAASRRAKGKQRFVPQQLAHVKRTGHDYRHNRDVTGQDYLDTFDFRGGEFGNWMSQVDRQASLNMGYDALMDLAFALQISPRDIAEQGTLAIAFGARGSGNAVAHYEPLRKVINLTKLRGAGSLAHEWWHSFDDYLGGKLGVNGFLSEHAEHHPLMQKLMMTIFFKPETPEQAARRVEFRKQRLLDNAERWLDAKLLYMVSQTGDEQRLQQYQEMKKAFLAGEHGTIERFSELRQELTGHGLLKYDREELEDYERAITEVLHPPLLRNVETDYLRNSRRMAEHCGKDGDYWDSAVEMSARAFACYVMDKLQPQRSDYLCGHAECAINMAINKDGTAELIKAFPQGEERKAINAVFDELIAELKREQLLTHVESVPLLQQKEAALAPAALQEKQLSMFSEEKPSIKAQLTAAAKQIKPKTAAHKAPNSRSQNARESGPMK